MKKAVTPKTHFIDKDVSPTIQSFIEYEIDSNLNESVHIIQKYFSLLNKKLNVKIGNMTMKIQSNGNLKPLVVSILLSLKNESALHYHNVIANLNKQIKKFNCVVELSDASLDTYMIVKNIKYFQGDKTRQYINETNVNIASMDIENTLMDI